MASSGVPIMRVVVVTPEQFVEDVVGDLKSRGGDIRKIAPVGELQGILAVVPVSGLYRYPGELDRITGGQARYEIKFSHLRNGGDDPDDGPGVRSPLKPRPPTQWGRAAARPPHDDLDPID